MENKMDEKATALILKLNDSFPETTIKYQYAKELHNFRIECEETTYWLYIDDNGVREVDDTFGWGRVCTFYKLTRQSALNN